MIVHHMKAVADSVAQGLIEGDSGSGFDPISILNWLAGILSGLVFIVAAYWSFKLFLSEGGAAKPGGGGTGGGGHESHGKNQLTILLNAAYTIAAITVGYVVIRFIVGMVRSGIGA